jgi:hypothetical protein
VRVAGEPRLSITAESANRTALTRQFEFNRTLFVDKFRGERRMSDSARWKLKGIVRNAEDFKNDRTVNPSDFECEYCKVPAVLCSYFDENIRCPHFRFLRAHAADCPQVNPAPTGDPGPGRPLPGRVIDELVLRDLAPPLNDPEVPGPSGPTRPGGPGGPGRPGEGRSVGTLRAVVRQYAENPQISGYPLRVPGASARTYGTLFRVLSQRMRENPTDVRIYYGKIMYTARMLDRPDGFEFTFRHGLPEQRFRLLVRTATWRRAQVADIRNAIDLAKDETRTAAMSAKADGAPSRIGESLPVPWVFFLGQRSAEDSSLFVVDHPAAICTHTLTGPL